MSSLRRWNWFPSAIRCIVGYNVALDDDEGSVDLGLIMETLSQARRAIPRVARKEKGSYMKNGKVITSYGGKRLHREIQYISSLSCTPNETDHLSQSKS